MQKNIIKIIEEWAMQYKPMLHVPGETSGNKRFFLVDSILNIPQIPIGINKDKTPCVAVEFQKEGTISGDRISSTHTVSILVKVDTPKMSEKERAAEAVEQAFQHGLDMIAWLTKKQNEGELPNLELENVPFDTIGPLYNNWYAVFFEFRDTRCVRMTK